MLNDQRKRFVHTLSKAEDNEKINNLQSQLDEVYINRALGAYVRSSTKWTEDTKKQFLL